MSRIALDNGFPYVSIVFERQTLPKPYRNKHRMSQVAFDHSFTYVSAVFGGQMLQKPYRNIGQMSRAASDNAFPYVSIVFEGRALLVRGRGRRPFVSQSQFPEILLPCEERSSSELL